MEPDRQGSLKRLFENERDSLHSWPLKWHNVKITVKSDMRSMSVSNCHFIFNQSTQPRLCTEEIRIKF